ncbi:exosortase/archaeosortase family protein [Anaerolinea thermolimosa]|nr:exosortase/archaeosortase family protein [Anaerolinea thermolimosa]GAP07144.1 exosortase/archaeosortase family protein [Anaerolinea thermolimosa]
MPGYVFFLLLFLYLGIIWFLRRYRIWLLYYVLGTAGLAYLLTLFLTRFWDMRSPLAGSVAMSVHFLLDLIHIETRVVENAPGALLVLVLTQRVGWTVLHIGVESSGLLEMIVLSSLISFYPGWPATRRIIRGATGLILTWGANLFRMLIIATLLHFFGKEVLVLAHTFLGKLVFFILTLAIYWALITFPSLRDIEIHLTRYRFTRV